MGLRVLWDFAYYGTSRTMGLRVLWDFALYGTSRSMGLRALWDFAPFGTSRLLGLPALSSRHQLHEERGTLPARRLAGRFATVLADAHNHEVMRAHDPRTLSAGAEHRVGVLRQRLASVAVDPEEAAAVHGARVGHPGRGECAHVAHVAAWEQALTIPHTVLQVEVREARPVAGGDRLGALAEEVAVWVGVDDRVAHAELVEEHALRERVIVLVQALGPEAHEVAGEDRVDVAVAADRVGLPLLRSRRRPPVGVRAPRVEVQVVRIA